MRTEEIYQTLDFDGSNWSHSVGVFDLADPNNALMDLLPYYNLEGDEAAQFIMMKGPKVVRSSVCLYTDKGERRSVFGHVIVGQIRWRITSEGIVAFPEAVRIIDTP